MVKMVMTHAQLQSMEAENRKALRDLQETRNWVESWINKQRIENLLHGNKVDPALYHLRDKFTIMNKKITKIQQIVKEVMKTGIINKSDAQRLEKHQTMVLIACQEDYHDSKHNGRYSALCKKFLNRLNKQIAIQQSIRKQMTYI